MDLSSAPFSLLHTHKHINNEINYIFQAHQVHSREEKKNKNKNDTNLDTKQEMFGAVWSWYTREKEEMNKNSRLGYHTKT